MTRTDLEHSWFVAPPLRGKWAILWILLALPVAALVRSTMHCTDMLGDCCTPFLLFVLLTAVLAGSTVSVLATLASTAVALWMFRAQGMQGMPMQPSAYGEIWGAGLFILYCLIIIGAVAAVRRSLVRYSRIDAPHEVSSGLIFSLERGQAWATWPGSATPVRLGPEQEVKEMMEDFIAQVELGRRFQRKAPAAAATEERS